MVTFTYEARPGELKAVELAPDEFNYRVEHDHWIVEFDDAATDGKRVSWIPRERVYEVTGAAEAFESGD